MSSTERWREPIASLPSEEALRNKEREGWRPVAIEWERVADEKAAQDLRKQPIPYGLRISSDCAHLEVDPIEREVISTVIALIAGDHPLSKIAAELNERDFRTRAGASWTQVSVFKLLPRIIEFGPEILSDHEWSESKKRLLHAVS